MQITYWKTQAPLRGKGRPNLSNRHSWEMLLVKSNNLCSHQRESSGEAFHQSLSTILLLFVQVPQNFRADYSESRRVHVLPDSGHRTLTKHVLEGSKPLWGNMLLYLCIPMLFAVLGLQIPLSQQQKSNPEAQGSQQSTSVLFSSPTDLFTTLTPNLHYFLT